VPILWQKDLHQKSTFLSLLALGLFKFVFHGMRGQSIRDALAGHFAQGRV
jgi:hypothetical protein